MKRTPLVVEWDSSFYSDHELTQSYLYELTTCSLGDFAFATVGPRHGLKLDLNPSKPLGGRRLLPFPLLMCPANALKEDGQTDGKVLVKWDVTPDVLEE